MGSWYNTIGRLNPCISTCGEKPTLVFGGSTSPQQVSDFAQKSIAWDTCMKTCAKTNAQNSISNTSIIDGESKQLPAETRPLELQDGSNLELSQTTGISKNTILIGIGALVIVAFLLLRRA